MSPNLLPHFRFGQTWSETKTLKILLESFCTLSLAHASSYFSLLDLIFLLGSCLFSLWSPSFPPAPIPPLSSHDLVIWTDSAASFPFVNGGAGDLANCFLCGTEATLSFSSGPACSSFSAKACVIQQALRWSWQHQQVCHFSSPLARFSPPSSLLPQTLWQELSSLSFCSIRLQQVPGHSFLPGNDAVDELASATPALGNLSPLISRIHSGLFSAWRHTFSSKFFGTQVPSIFTEELVLPRHARCALPRLRCNGHSLLLTHCLRPFFLICAQAVVFVSL